MLFHTHCSISPYTYINIVSMIEGSLEVKLPTIWTDEKSRGGKSQRREEKRRSEKRKSQKKDVGARQGRKSRGNTVFFQWFVAPEGPKVGSLKRRVRSHVARWEMKNCTLLWRKAHLHAVVARSTCPSQNVQSTPDVQKVHAVVARSTKSKSRCTKHTSFGALLEVEIFKKCTPLWRKAHFEVKPVKNWGSRATFGS